MLKYILYLFIVNICSDIDCTKVYYNSRYEDRVKFDKIYVATFYQCDDNIRYMRIANLSLSI